LTLSELQYLVRDTASRSTKRQDWLEIWRGHVPLGLLLATPVVTINVDYNPWTKLQWQ